MLSEHNKLEKQITKIKAELATLPSGNLICSRNYTRFKWYCTNGSHRTYIPKKDRPLAEQLARKKYLTLRLRDLLNEQHAISAYLNHHQFPTNQAEELLTNSSEFQNLLKPYFKPLSHKLSEWASAPYERSTKYPEQLIHKSISGNILRSKSEAMIDTLLYIHKVPFHYEEALYLGETILFPDFTIMHPVTGVIYYWEHFGMIDSPNYAQSTFSKLQLYTSYEIYPSIQLIITFETKSHPFTMEDAEKIIYDHFLSPDTGRL